MSDIIKINDWTLTKIEEEREPLILDTELAAKLGYTRPGSIRILIKRLIQSGALGVCNKTMQTSGSKGGRPAEVYYLTERQALKIIAHAETEIANKILDEVIDVYESWRKGELPAPVPVSQDLSSLTAQVAQLAQVVASLVSLQTQSLIRQEPLPAASRAPLQLVEIEPPVPIAPSRSAPPQADLFAPRKRWRWYSAWQLAQRLDIDISRLWVEFRLAGGDRRHHVTKSQYGYQIREDVAEKIVVQRKHQEAR